MSFARALEDKAGVDSLPEVQDIADNGHAIFLYDGGIAKAGEFLDSFLEVTGVNDL